MRRAIGDDVIERNEALFREIQAIGEILVIIYSLIIYKYAQQMYLNL